MAGCSILLYNCWANIMDGVSLSYTRVASAISGGLRVHSVTWIAMLNSLLKLITVLGSSAFQKALLNSLLKLITMLWSSALQKALTGKKWAGRVGPWASRLPEVNTSIHLNFQAFRRPYFCTSRRMAALTYRNLHSYTSKPLHL